MISNKQFSQSSKGRQFTQRTENFAKAYAKDLKNNTLSSPDFHQKFDLGLPEHPSNIILATRRDLAGTKGKDKRNNHQMRQSAPQL